MNLAGFLHRSDVGENTNSSPTSSSSSNYTVNEKDFCDTRIRLTPSNPSVAGATWYHRPLAVSHGFDTTFEFVIHDHSRQCSTHNTQYLSSFHHKTCSVRGADGFAFVLHMNIDSDEELFYSGLSGGNYTQRELFANAPKNFLGDHYPENSNYYHPYLGNLIGEVGGKLGFKGIPNSIGIIFDIWQNPGEDQILGDSIRIEAQSYEEAVDENGKTRVKATSIGTLGVPKVHSLADGKKHKVRIMYYPELKPEYFDHLIASDNLLKFLKDNGEQKRIGTLIVYIDEDIENDKPIMVMPLNLSLLLKMKTDELFVGFTAATGRFYAKHDLISWKFCESSPCTDALPGEVPRDQRKDTFDYRQEDVLNKNLADNYNDELVLQGEDIRLIVEPGSQTELDKEKLGNYLRYFTPGEGFGGGEMSTFPTKHKSPDTSTWRVPLTTWSDYRVEGLASDADKQVPPNTLY